MTAGIGELVGGSQREERIEACRRAKPKIAFSNADGFGMIDQVHQQAIPPGQSTWQSPQKVD